ncbi:hypothetical protein [Gymnodinialimonas ulvae]|uniref:hypothetical protein n=1 Tax=Gymnodinialimonas ulvae TaxID=3126504 RepID=UPI0030B2B62A
MGRFSKSLAILSATFFCGPVIANCGIETVENQTNTALSALYGLCLNDQFDATGMRNLAEQMRWESVDPEMVQTLNPTPQIEFDFLDGYIIPAPGDPPLPALAFVGASSEAHGVVEYCSWFFDDVPSEEFVTSFICDSDAEMVSDETRIGDRVRFFSIPDLPDHMVMVQVENRNSRGLRVTTIVGGLR